MAEAAKRYSTFAVFYPLYLSEHANRTCRRLHFVGTSIGLAFLLHTFLTLNFWWLLAALVGGYTFAWVGHFVFEKNRPATFQYPCYSFAGDWVMWKGHLMGKIRP